MGRLRALPGAGDATLVGAGAAAIGGDDAGFFDLAMNYAHHFILGSGNDALGIDRQNVLRPLAS